MGLNQSFAHSNSNNLKFDFELNDNYTQEDLKQSTNKPCGILTIQNKEYPISIHELQILSDTLTSAREVIHKKHTIGLMRR